MQSDIYEYYKEDPSNKVWRVKHYRLIDKKKGIVDGNIDTVLGELLFSFDKKKIYNLWTDYPQKFTEKEKEIFDKENPYWNNFFKYRNKNNHI